MGRFFGLARVTLVAISVALVLVSCGGGEDSALITRDSGRSRPLAVLSESQAAVVSLTKVSEIRVSRTVYDYVFKVTVKNAGDAYTSFAAKVVGTGQGTTVVDGDAVFGDIGTGATVTSPDTITLRHDRTNTFNTSAIKWSFSGSPYPAPLLVVTDVGNGVIKLGVKFSLPGTITANCVSGSLRASSTGGALDSSVTLTQLVNDKEYACTAVVLPNDTSLFKSSRESNVVHVTPIAIASNEPLHLLTGTLVDSPVAGLGYRTTTVSGSTDSAGKFQYAPGEQIAFFIGKQPIGTAQGQALVHISDVTASGLSAPIPGATIQMAQLLQSLDAKVNPNVITIDSTTAAVSDNATLPFGVSGADFAAAFATVFPQYTLVSEQAAQQHLDQYLAAIASNYDDACGVPRRIYKVGSVSDASTVSIDTTSIRFNCASRGQIVAFMYSVQPAISQKLSTIFAQGSVFDDAAQNEQALLDAASNQNALQVSIKSVGYAAEALDAAVHLQDATTVGNVTKILTGAALSIVDKYVASSSVDADTKAKSQSRIKLAKIVLDITADSIDCKQAKIRAESTKTCAEAVLSAMRLAEPALEFAAAGNPQALLAVEDLGAAFALISSLSDAKLNPAKTQAALATFAADFVRIQGALLANAALPPGSTWSVLVEGALAEGSAATTAYFNCKALASGNLGSLKACWEGTIPRLVDNLAKGVFRSGLLWSLWQNEKATAALYLTDFIIREYLSVGGDMQVLYARRAISKDTATSYCFIRLNCPTTDLDVEKAKFGQLLDQLKGKGQWRDNTPLDETWAEFTSTIQSLRALANLYGRGDELALAAENVPGTLSVNLTLQAPSAVVSEIICTADGATPSNFTVTAGGAKTQAISYAATGAYQVHCTGVKSGAPVVNRSLAIAVMSCGSNQVVQFGKCVTPLLTAISPSSAEVGVPTEFTVVGKYLPLNVSMSVEGGTCGPATAITSSGFRTTCTHLGPIGEKSVTVILGSGSSAITDSTRRVSIVPAALPPISKWDAVSDFSLTANPNKAWAYGFDGPGRVWQPMTATISNCSQLHINCWLTNAGAYEIPLIGINNSGVTINGGSTVVIPTGMLVMHPGFTSGPTSPLGYGLRPVIRWTVPSAGNYVVSGRFQILDVLPSGVRTIVQLDGNPLIDQVINGYGTSKPISLNLALIQGQILSFIVDAAGGHGNDSTGLVVSISKQ